MGEGEDVIPAKAGIQCFLPRYKILWAPVFTGETNTVRFFHPVPSRRGEGTGSGRNSPWFIVHGPWLRPCRAVLLARVYPKPDFFPLTNGNAPPLFTRILSLSSTTGMRGISIFFVLSIRVTLSPRSPTSISISSPFSKTR